MFTWKYKIEQKYLENMKLANIDYTKKVEEIEVKEIKEEQQQIQQKPEFKLLKMPERIEIQKTDETKQIENVENITNSEKNITEKSKDTLCTTKDLNIIKNTINAYKDGNICPSLRALQELTNIKRHIIQAAKKQLEEDGYLRTDGRTTYVQEVSDVHKVTN